MIITAPGATSGLGLRVNRHLDSSWRLDPEVADGLRNRCPLAREHLLKMVAGLEGLLAEIEDPTFWEPMQE